MPERPLWAPWRLEYVQSDRQTECIFCLAASADQDQAKWIVERGERSFTMLNTFPYAPGHLLIAPLRHVAELDELDGDEMPELLVLARRGITALRSAMSAHGFNVGLNLGEVAGAGIADHLHLHVVPRWQGDNNFMPVLADTRIMNEALEAAHSALVEALPGVA